MKDLFFLVKTFSILFYMSSRVIASPFITLERVETLDNMECTGSSLVFYDKYNLYRTVVDCIATCLTYSTCHGIFYTASRHTCHGCTEDVRLGLGSPDIVDANMATQFYLRAKPSSHGDPCSSDMTCGVNQYCAGTGTCTCNPGFSYSSTMDRCNTGCLIQGSTYEKHVQKRIYLHNIDMHLNIPLQDCKDSCTAQTYCRSFEYRASESTCWLQSATALTAPGDFVSATKAYYDRNCD